MSEDTYSRNMKSRKRSLTECSDSTEDTSEDEKDTKMFKSTTGPRYSSQVQYASNSNQFEESTMAQNMMKNMGYETGKGLGKFQQGMVDPIEASNQRGRRGLGFSVPGLEAQDNLIWDSSQEHIVVEEEVTWLPVHPDVPPNWDCVEGWAEGGTRKLDISDEVHFCNPEVLKGVLKGKTVFDNLGEKEKLQSRTRSNPYETIGRLFFQNRAAIKMANLDAVFEFMFTSPVDEDDKSLIGPEEVLYFADVCAAPGGFSEYVLWRRKQLSGGFCDAKGFGFTLKTNDFKLHDFFAASPEFFEPHYGFHGDGDIFKPENISAFRSFVLKQTNGLGVHFMMADGGFSVTGQENIQEILSKQLYICQCLMALGIVREGGHFVCKLFDIFTPFSVGLIYLLYRCFKLVCIHKPNSSRPANSERYVVCKWRRADIEWIYEYLFIINKKLVTLPNEDDNTVDILDLVPFQYLRDEIDFFNYIVNSNNDLGNRQITALEKIRTFCQDTSLTEGQQSRLKSESLDFWRLPDQCRVAPMSMSVQEKVRKLLNLEDPNVLSVMPKNLTTDNLQVSIRTPYDYRFVVLASPSNENRRERGFYLGQGGGKVFRWNGYDASGWLKFDTRVELPADTLVYAELVSEYPANGSTSPITALHLIDGITLNGYDIQHIHYVQRHRYLRKFALSINKVTRADITPIRCKQLHKLQDLSEVVNSSRMRNGVMKPRLGRVKTFEEGISEQGTPIIVVPTGILLLKITQDPWMLAYSQTSQRKYLFNTQTRKSTFDTPKESIAPFLCSRQQGMHWWWGPGVQVCPDDDPHPDKLHMNTLTEYFQSVM